MRLDLLGMVKKTCRWKLSVLRSMELKRSKPSSGNLRCAFKGLIVLLVLVSKSDRVSASRISGRFTSQRVWYSG